MRKARVFLPQLSVRRASITLPRASTFWLGATASSRSRNTTSAGVPRAFSIIFSLLPGVDSSHRRKRIFVAPRVCCLRHLVVWTYTPVVGKSTALDPLLVLLTLVQSKAQ